MTTGESCHAIRADVFRASGKAIPITRDDVDYVTDDLGRTFLRTIRPALWRGRAYGPGFCSCGVLIFGRVLRGPVSSGHTDAPCRLLAASVMSGLRASFVPENPFPADGAA